MIQIIKKNTIELALSLFFFCMFLWGSIVKILDLEIYIDNLLYFHFFFPISFSIVYSLNKSLRGKYRLIYYLSFLIVVPLFIFQENLSLFTENNAFFLTLVLSVFLMFVYGNNKEVDKVDKNRYFVYDNIYLFIDAIFAFAVGLLFFGVVTIIFVSVNYIFELNYREESFVEICLCFSFCIISSLLFCYLRGKREIKEFTKKHAISTNLKLPEIVSIGFNYIIFPGIILYTAILYSYIIFILINQNLPKGGVALMVLAFYIVGIVSSAVNLLSENKYYGWFYNNLSFIAVAPLILFWVGLLYRVCSYGLTENRVYLLSAGILMILFSVFLRCKTLNNYRLMLIICMVVIIILTYIPGISASDIGSICLNAL